MGENEYKIKKNLMIDSPVVLVTKNKQDTLDYLIKELEVNK